MIQPQPQALRVVATVTEVLPITGLAYVTDCDGRDWTITKSTTGGGLRTLGTGVHVELSIMWRDGLSFVSEYRALG